MIKFNIFQKAALKDAFIRQDYDYICHALGFALAGKTLTVKDNRNINKLIRFVGFNDRPNFCEYEYFDGECFLKARYPSKKSDVTLILYVRANEDVENPNLTTYQVKFVDYKD